MKRAAVLTACLFFGLAAFFPSPAYCQNWKIFGWTMGGDCSLMYDEDRCAVQDANTVRVPVLKTGWSNDCRDKELANLAAMGFPAGVLQNWSQTVQVYEINVKSRNYRIVSTSVYDMQGNQLAITQAASGWYCVVPGSATDKLVNTLTGTPEPKEAQEILMPVPVPQGYPEYQQPQSKQAPPSVPIPLYR
ncbi:MAG: hypothetical protein ABFD62_13605 [Syntrophaceae bacterium]